MSARSSEFELWVADVDGGNAVQLTSLRARPGFPSWSPDGATIAFHSDPEGHPDALTVPASGGKVRIVTPGDQTGSFPSFSRDGMSIYYTAREPGIWKMAVSGGEAVKLVNRRAAVSVESYDGRDLYFLEATAQPSAVWRQPLAGGEPVQVLEGVVNGAFAVVEAGIYYIERGPGQAGTHFNDRVAAEARLRFYDFATKATTTIAPDLGAVISTLTASRDGRTLFFSRVDAATDELIVVDRFR
jgi:dipeptidyl aminopeptidase/acylaminoacyl peptidase